MFCSNCGNQLNQGDAFCNSCGNRIEKENVSDIRDSVTTPSSRDSASSSSVNQYGSTQSTVDFIEKEVISLNDTETSQIDSTLNIDSIFPAQRTPQMPLQSFSSSDNNMTLQTNNTGNQENRDMYRAVSSSIQYNSSTPVNNMGNVNNMNEKKVKEKIYFGKGAFIFFIFVVALLSIAAGIFAGLYFDEIGYSLNFNSVVGIEEIFTDLNNAGN